MSGTEFKKAMDERRIGCLFIGAALINFEPDSVKPLLDRMLIVETRQCWNPPGCRYTGYSPDVEEGKDAPRLHAQRVFGGYYEICGEP